MATGTFDQATLDAMKELQHKQWVHLFGPDRKVTARVDLQSHTRIRKRVSSYAAGVQPTLARDPLYPQRAH
jgi:hypothetical protein